jgi:5-methylcytosine-specific restriction protein A
MPLAAKHPCRGGCGRLASAAYCEACKAAGKGRDRRISSTKRGYGYRWQQASAGYLREHPIAVDYFGTHNGVIYWAEEVDHIIPRRGDDPRFWDSSNWQGLTHADHSRKTALEDGGFGR